MESLTPRRTALFIALSILLGMVVGGVLLVFVGLLEVSFPFILLWSFAIAALAYGISLFVVQRFIQARVNLILRAVHETRMAKSGGERMDADADVLGELNREIADWADQRSTEIIELKEREQYRREFIGNLAHELKTPIFNIQGYILTLLEGGLEDPKVNRDFLNRASNGVDRLIKIVEDLDLITQLESGVMAMTIGRMDLRELVREVVDELEMQAREKGVRLVCALDEPLWVKADRDRLSQVFFNLFTNAINYGRESGVCEVRCFPLAEQVLVEVADDGIGISAEHLPRLFERFYRVGKSRSRHEGGSGLGLAIVKHIIESHGQSISVKSEEGKGTTFSFTVQRAK